MATAVKVNDFVEQLAKGVHSFGTHTFKLVLTNVDPTTAITTAAAVTAVTGVTFISGGPSIAIPNCVISETGGTATVVGDQVVFTASGGSVGPFQYYVMFNDTATSPADAVVAYWNHGSTVTLNDGETFTVKFNNATTAGTIFTLA